MAPSGSSATSHRPRSTAGAAGVGALVLAAGAAASAIRRNTRRNAAIVDNVAPELRPWVAALPPSFLTGYDPAPPRRDTRAERVLSAAIPVGLGRRETLPGRDGDPDVPAYVYDPPGRTRRSGALLWIHGGGMIGGAPWMDHGLCTRIARELGVLVLSVDYRLAPEHPFPAGPEDCYTALAWLHDRADDLGLDRDRIAVGGASAGGGLAAIVAQMAHDRGLPVAFQALVYPMLDDRTVLTDRGEDVGRLVWTPEKNRDAWRWFHGRDATLEEGLAYASAARRQDLRGLPPAWIGVGSIDLFHAEDVEYARRLQDAGVDVELLVVEGMPHAADVFGWVPSMRDFRSALVAALGRAVGSDVRTGLNR
ncbi:alpha/beta hydrolase [Agilicoccus flavus]|uniref:alpha/beta hydrolase n=1 Tax=Agilicoccus flavus TaxID=2775968 RepID=UPI001CF69B62|nr:alpha/beta hydrolase [Agilicoccus flavus]